MTTLDLTDIIHDPSMDAFISPEIRAANALYDSAVCLHATRQNVRLVIARIRRTCGTAVAARALLDLALRDKTQADKRTQRIALSDLQIWVKEVV